MDTRKVFKAGSSIAVTLPPHAGFAVGDTVKVVKGSKGAVMITKLEE